MESVQRTAGGAIGRRLARPETWILATVGICWALAIGLVLAGRSDLISHDAIIEDGNLPILVAIPIFLVIWQLMTGAMMLPSILPVVRIYGRITAASPRRVASLSSFIGAYFVIWTAFAGLALASDSAIHFTVDRWAWLAAHEELISGALLIGAGIFQLTPLKERCLTECRNPLQFVWRRYAPGVRGAWRLGIANGIYCLGCCWALMLVMFGVGVGSVTLMAALGGVMVLEKTWRGGARLVPAVSVGLIVVGAMVILVPGWIGSLPPLP
jgi:predicted metal-binding membrane protein